MKIIGLITLIIGMTFLNCNQSYSSMKANNGQAEKLLVFENSDEKVEIQKLIRQALKWADSEKSIDLLPVIRDKKDSIYIGFDIELHKQNLDKLKETGFFAKEFVENYNQIILTLDRKLRNKEFKYKDWLVGDLPIFKFANGANPWCYCQDNLNWETVEVEIIKLNSTSGELKWKWGNLGEDHHSSWKNFSYDFKVVKENEKWKISYLHGFDFEESTKSDGEL
jgi:hypothetical protein